MSRPTLARQLEEQERREEIAKLSEEELINLFRPHTFWQRLSFWVFCHIPLLHSLFWGIICWFYPYNIDAHARHWRWEEPE